LSSAQYDTLHWDGDILVFQTNASGQFDDIKIGTSGDIAPLDPSFTGLTFWDRGPGGAVTFCHNSGGTSYIGYISPTAAVGLITCGGSYLQSNGSTFTFAEPSSFVWSSAPFDLGPGAKVRRPSYQVGIGQGALLGMFRTDGMTDGLNTLQGTRMMDSTAGTWTTPDAYAGDVDDPGSQKSYMWNNNDAVAYSDPSGYYANCMSHDRNAFWVGNEESATDLGEDRGGDPGMTTVASQLLTSGAPSTVAVDLDAAKSAPNAQIVGQSLAHPPPNPDDDKTYSNASAYGAAAGVLDEPARTTMVYNALRHGGRFDYQRMAGPNATPAASNFAVGVIFEAARYSIAQMMTMSNAYLFLFSNASGRQGAADKSNWVAGWLYTFGRTFRPIP
jgi:hypothetical protein